MQLVVQATSIARWIVLLIAPPQWGSGSVAVDAHHGGSRTRLTIVSAFGLVVVVVPRCQCSEVQHHTSLGICIECAGRG